MAEKECSTPTREGESPVNDYWGFESTDPLPVEGGIKAQSQRGPFAKTWWASRWERALTRWVDPSRLARARGYARRGQVIELDIRVGLIVARVQGTRPTPYRVRVEVKTLSEAEWGGAVDAMAGQAIYVAQLLNGEMPHEIERAFHAAGVSLFPATSGELVTECSCPDWSNPCKHTAAVFLLVGEYLDQDPFLVFAMRGRTREQIMSSLRARRADHATGSTSASANGPASGHQPDLFSVGVDSPLEECLEDFWRLGPELLRLQVRVKSPDAELQALKVLGDPTFAEDKVMYERLAEVYRTVSRAALEVAYSEHEANTTP